MSTLAIIKQEIRSRYVATLKITVLALAIAAAGCGSLMESVTDNANADNAQPGGNTAAGGTEGKADNAAGSCSNEYYPIKAVERGYRITGDGPGTYWLAQRQSDGQSFVEVRTFGDGLTVETNWACTEEGLRSTEYKNTITMKQGNFEMDTLKSTGITLPKEWESGKEWNATYDVRVNIAAGPVNTAADGKVTIDNKLVNLNDTVTANEQTYEAARIDSVISVVISMRGTTTPATKLNIKNWYAKDIGIVRQEASSQFGKQLVEYIGTK
jgi:hypothetical protein